LQDISDRDLWIECFFYSQTFRRGPIQGTSVAAPSR